MKKKTARKKMPSAKFLIRSLDAMFATRVKDRDGYTCLRCGTKQDPLKKIFVQCSHVIGKRYKALRWDMDNAKVLCFGCHKFWWHSPQTQFEAAVWFQNKYPERAKRITAIYSLKVPDMTRRELYDLYLSWVTPLDKRQVSMQ